MPPAEQVMPDFRTANNNDCSPRRPLEFDCTRQPGAVSKAEFCKPMVCGAIGSRPSRHNGMVPLILAVALARNCISDVILKNGV